MCAVSGACSCRALTKRQKPLYTRIMHHDDLITKIGDIRDDESGTSYYRVPMSAGPDAEPVPILDILREQFAGRSCSCSHDCCGHWQTDHGRLIGTDAIREHYIIAQSFYRNV